METPNNSDVISDKSGEAKPQKFNRNEFTIFMEKMSNNVDTFYVKSEVMFQKISNAIIQWFTDLKSKFQKLFKKKSVEDQQIKLSKKLYKQQQELEKSIKNIEATMERTSELTQQIKEDTSTIVLKIDQVVFILEHQMNTIGKIPAIEDYMKSKLGTDWTQIKNVWSKYKDGHISRGDFIKEALKKMGKQFLGIFVNTAL